MITLSLKLTVLENTLLALQGTRPSRFHMFRSFSTYPELLSRAHELLERWSLLEKGNQTAAELSYGDQRRLEIVLSLALKPKLLLLDEPSNGLTAAECVDIVDMIYGLGPDVAVLVVAHDLDLVFGVAQRIVVFHYGQIIADGTPKEIQTNTKVREIYMGIHKGRRGARAR
jgi:branched-chain amino acid transport system ATP-binding protein